MVNKNDIVSTFWNMRSSDAPSSQSAGELLAANVGGNARVGNQRGQRVFYQAGAKQLTKEQLQTIKPDLQRLAQQHAILTIDLMGRVVDRPYLEKGNFGVVFVLSFAANVLMDEQVKATKAIQQLVSERFPGYELDLHQDFIIGRDAQNLDPVAFVTQDQQQVDPAGEAVAAGLNRRL